MLQHNSKKSSCRHAFTKLDIFGYPEIEKTKSNCGAVLSLLAFGILVFSFMTAVNNVEMKFSQISSERLGMSEASGTLPRYGITFARGLRKKAYNESWVKVKFQHNTIFESDRNKDKPRKKVPLGGTVCSIETRPGVKQDAYCPDAQDDAAMSAVQGEYASSVYQYITATIVPCHKYKAEFEANGGTCESQAEIERVFLDSYGGASLWIKDQYNHKSSAWASKAYTSFSRNAWIGNEVYFEPTDYTKFNFWGQASEQTKFLTYRSFYQRQSAPNPNEYLKFYLRVSTSSKKVHETLFGAAGMIEMVGSTWSVLVLTLGSLAMIINMCLGESRKQVLPVRRQMSNGSFRRVTDQAIVLLAKSVKSVQSTLVDAGMMKESDKKTFDVENPMTRCARTRPVEIVFSFDTTSSMSGYIDSVKNHLKEITKELFDKIPNLKVGIIAHGDYCDSSIYVIKTMDFTRSYDDITKFLEQCIETGGGDPAECYELALQTARKKFSWTNQSVRSFVLIGDDVPHEPSFRRGNIDWRKELDKLNGMQVTCYGIQCGNNDYASHFYDAIAAKTAGLKLKLSKFDSMPAIFIGICLKQVDPLGELLKEYESKLEQTGQMTGEKKKALHSLGKQAIIGAALTAGGVFTKVVLDA